LSVSGLQDHAGRREPGDGHGGGGRITDLQRPLNPLASLAALPGDIPEPLRQRDQGRQTLMFLTKEAVRLASEGFARAVACDGCPPLADLVERYAKADGRFLVCPICVQARNVDPSGFAANAEVGGTVPMWEWIGDDPVVAFSY
jgi:hypothetical protein